MIVLENISKSYGDKKALDNLSLELHDGEIFGLIGHNGAGKSTTIKSIVSIISPDSGDIFIDNMNIKDHRQEIKKTIGYVSDSPDLFLKLRAIDYWNFVGKVFEVEEEDLAQRISQLMELFELEDAFTTIEEMSHGMRQKVFLIGALLSNPETWILDEPMTGLDPQASHNLKEMMRQHADKGNTVLFSTHVLEVAQELCDRIGILRKGRLIFLGTMEELKAQFPDKSLEEIYLDMIKAYD